MLPQGLEKFALNWGSIGQSALQGARSTVPLAAGLGAAMGAIAPGQDAEGHQRGRLSGALHGGLRSGLIGGAGAALGFGGMDAWGQRRPGGGVPAQSTAPQQIPGRASPGQWPVQRTPQSGAPTPIHADMLGNIGNEEIMQNMKRGFYEGVKAAALKFGVR